MCLHKYCLFVQSVTTSLWKRLILYVPCALHFTRRSVQSLMISAHYALAEYLHSSRQRNGVLCTRFRGLADDVYNIGNRDLSHSQLRKIPFLHLLRQILQFKISTTCPPRLFIIFQRSIPPCKETRHEIILNRRNKLSFE